MKEKTKLKLEDIKVESFITTLKEVNLNEVVAGATDDRLTCGCTDRATCGCSVDYECKTFEFETCMTCDGACFSDWGTCASNPCC